MDQEGLKTWEMINGKWKMENVENWSNDQPPMTILSPSFSQLRMHSVPLSRLLKR